MRKHYLDNIRWGIVVLVVLYHIIYLFNNVGVISNIDATGIPQMDALLYFVYPWFMCCLFLVAGISAHYSLKKRTNSQFIKERAKRLLIPSIGTMFLLGWISGYVTSRYTDIFGGNADKIPAVIKYFIFCLIGNGPLWFLHELFIACLVLLLVRCLDSRDHLFALCEKIKLPIILLLVFPVWGSSFLLNMPVITVYRNGIYILMFLLGYYVFAHDSVIDILKKYHLPLMITALIFGISYTFYYYGQDYTSSACLQSFFTNCYLWVMILAILGCSKAWFDRKTAFTKYISSRSFAIYIIHYPLLVLSSYLLTTYTQLPMAVIYVLLLLIQFTLGLVLIEGLIRIPIIRFWLFGIFKKDQHQKQSTLSA